MKIDYREARKEVSIVQVLLDLGYKYDKSKGGVSPNFVLRDEHGKEIDRVIVKNPKDLENQGYWRRDGGKGDLIDLIRENLTAFRVTGRNDVDTLNKVLAWEKRTTKLSTSTIIWTRPAFMKPKSLMPPDMTG